MDQATEPGARRRARRIRTAAPDRDNTAHDRASAGGDQRLGGGTAAFAGRGRAVERLLDAATAACHSSIVALVDQNRAAVAGEDLCDARTHQAASDHSDYRTIHDEPPLAEVVDYLDCEGSEAGNLYFDLVTDLQPGAGAEPDSGGGAGHDDITRL